MNQRAARGPTRLMILMALTLAVSSGIRGMAKAEGQSPGHEALANGIRLYEEGQYDRALTDLADALLQLPVTDEINRARAHTHRALCYYLIGDMERFTREARSAAEAWPQGPALDHEIYSTKLVQAYDFAVTGKKPEVHCPGSWKHTVKNLLVLGAGAAAIGAYASRVTADDAYLDHVRADTPAEAAHFRDRVEIEDRNSQGLLAASGTLALFALYYGVTAPANQVPGTAVSGWTRFIQRWRWPLFGGALAAGLCGLSAREEADSAYEEYPAARTDREAEYLKDRTESKDREAELLLSIASGLTALSVYGYVIEPMTLLSTAHRTKIKPWAVRFLPGPRLALVLEL